MCYLVNKKYEHCKLNAKRLRHLAVCGVGSLARWLPVAFVVQLVVNFTEATVVGYHFFVFLVIGKGDCSV